MTDPTRRAVIASVGAGIAGLAGCNVLSDDEEDPPRFEPDATATILAEDAPAVDRPVPIEPAATAIDEGLARVDALVESVPKSLSATDVPNGVVREEILSTRERARSKRADVEAEADRFRALRSMPGARRRAREAATALEAVGEDLAPDVLAEREAVRTGVGTRLVAVDYAGADRSRTLLLAFRLEDWLETARRIVRRGVGSADPSALDVGEVGGSVEYGAATAEAVDHLAERHAGEAGDAEDFRSGFEFALESSIRVMGRADLPDPREVPEDWLGEEIDDRSVENVLDEALRAVRGRDERVRIEMEEDRLGIGLARALELERDARALEAVTSRLAEGEIETPASVDPIRAEREAALEAADAVPVDPETPTLAADVFARNVDRLRLTDRGVERYVDRDRDARLSREYAEYVYVRAQLEALPEAIEAIRGRLEGR